ncbi:MAG: hypothetical protein PHD25_01210 [Bacteroidales bacterium]|nr:hypothetical protein [Bacteroidales bacterium]
MMMRFKGLKITIPGLLKKLPKLTVWFILLLLIIYNLSYKIWNTGNKPIVSDVMGYYLYLPAVVIHGNDLYLDFIKEDVEFYMDKVWFLKSPTGKGVIQFTCGLSILYSPFFLIAHGMAPLLGFEANGYTLTYKIALLVSCIFYLGLGLLFLRKILSRYVSEITSSITLFTVVIGTNLLYYATIEAPMSHAYSFALITGFLYTVIKWYENPRYLTSIVLGLLGGIITLIRPTNAVVVILFLFWGTTSLHGPINRLKLFIREYKKLIIILLFACLVWIPQLLYWKTVAGSYFYFSYGSKAGFFFHDPEIINVLFSYRKGWLLYTPVMALALAGIPLLPRYMRGSFWPVLLFTLVNIYIISSWCDWWYGGSFGLRAFIDSYGILALPLAALIQWILTKKIWIRISSVIFLAFLIFFNNFQVNQYIHGAIHFASMTKKAYWETFGKMKPTKEYYQYLEYPDYKGLQEKLSKQRQEREARRQAKESKR